MSNEESTESRLGEEEAVGSLLLRAAKLIETPKSWTRRAFARDRHSHPVSPTSKRAVRFCVGGALLRAASEQYSFTIRTARGDEQCDFIAPKPLAEAYRVVGKTIVGFVDPEVLRVREEKRGKLNVPIVVYPLLDPGGEGEEASWPGLVHSLNDAKRIHHTDLLVALKIAWVSTLSADAQRLLRERRFDREPARCGLCVSSAGPSGSSDLRCCWRSLALRGCWRADLASALPIRPSVTSNRHLKRSPRGFDT